MIDPLLTLNEESSVSIQELGSLGEILAAAATVATLIYLSMQIKLNNRLAVSTIENQLNSREYERRFAIAMDPAFAGFLARDWRTETLDDAERTQAAQYITMLVIDARETFLQNKLGFVSMDLLESRMTRLRMGVMESEVAKSVWAVYAQIVEKDFAAYFEAEIFPSGLKEGLQLSHPQFKKDAE
jgi:hypothetical protein